MNQSENFGYSFEADETFEWSSNHKILALKNALGSLKEECLSESQVIQNHSYKDLLDTTGKVLGALESAFERDYEDEQDEDIYMKSDEPWD